MLLNYSLFNFIWDVSLRVILTDFEKSTFKFLLLKYTLNSLRIIYIYLWLIDDWMLMRTWNTGYIWCRRNHTNKKMSKRWYAHLMQAVLNNCRDFFIAKIVTQSRLVLKTQFYTSSITLGAHQEETSLDFYFPLN